MRKCSKKLLAVLTAAAMVCGLAACGGDSKESSSGAPAGESRAEEGGKEEEGSDAAEGSGEGEAESGGSGDASAAGRISQEEITLEVTGPQPSGLEDWTKLAVIEEYANRLGIRLNCNFYQTDWETQRTLMVADDKVPDLVINAGIGIGDMNKWGGGIFPEPEGLYPPDAQHAEDLRGISRAGSVCHCLRRQHLWTGQSQRGSD